MAMPLFSRSGAPWEAELWRRAAGARRPFGAERSDRIDGE
jgi:hypothetical protein